jgi:hypothetical protein
MRGDAARRQAGLSGLAVAVLFGGGSAVWGLEMPSGGTPVGDVVDFYRDTADRIVIGASASLLAIGAFVWFAAAVRQVLLDAGADEVLATTAFGGAVLGMAAGMGAETINMAGALRAQDGDLSGPLAQALFEISQILGSVASGVGGGVFAVAVGVAALRTPGALPRPIALVVLGVGIALLTPLSYYVNVFAGAAVVVLTAVIAVSMLRRVTRPLDPSIARASVQGGAP